MSRPAFLVEIHIWNKRSLELALLKLVPGRGRYQWQRNSYVRREENTSKHNTLEVTYGTVDPPSRRRSQPCGSSTGHGWTGSDAGSLPIAPAWVRRKSCCRPCVIKLSCRVVSVECSEQLEVSAGGGGDRVAMRKVFFTPEDAGRSYGELDLGFCKMEVTVAWSLFLPCLPRIFSCRRGAWRGWCQHWIVAGASGKLLLKWQCSGAHCLVNIIPFLVVEFVHQVVFTLGKLII